MSTTVQEREKLLASKGITSAQSALFCVVHYGMTATPERLPECASRPNYSLGRPVTEAECREALDQCLNAGWLRIIDEGALAEIKELLQQGGFLGPIYGMPMIGGVDFTEQGAELWQELDPLGGRTPAFAFMDTVHVKTAFVFKTEAAARAKVKEINADPYPGLTVTGPAPIGPWRAQWWRQFSAGYRVDVEDKRKWSGLASDQAYRSIQIPQGMTCEPKRLRTILDRHNVTAAEWRLLAAMENCESHHPWSISSWTLNGDKLGFQPSDEERRAALTDCIRNGWLQIVELETSRESRKRLQNDYGIWLRGCDGDRTLGVVDFTSAGATLYQMIAAEIWGSNWDDAISVEDQYYAKVHRYCETEEGLLHALEEYRDAGEQILSHRIMPIGPWCVYWWERFPAGYLMEVEIGER